MFALQRLINNKSSFSIFTSMFNMGPDLSWNLLRSLKRPFSIIAYGNSTRVCTKLWRNLITFVKNVSINKTLTIIILIKGAFPLDRHRKKYVHLIPKNKQLGQNKFNNKKEPKLLPFRFKHCRMPWEYTLIIKLFNSVTYCTPV